MTAIPDPDATKNVIDRAASADSKELISIWRAHDAAQWGRTPEIFRTVAERLLAQGEPLLAYDVVAEALALWPNDIRLRQLQGLALARSGATERANAILEELRHESQVDEETLGMLGRTYKDLATAASTPAQRETHLKRAAQIYGEAYQTTAGYWTGVNAATMNLVVGENEKACALANEVRAQCLKHIEDSAGDQYWEFAALGEAALICRDLSEAEKWYTEAAKAGRGRFGDVQSSRRNARMILQYWREDPNWIDQYLPVSSVIVFAGHMIDRPDRSTPRFPKELESAVAKEIRAKIANLKPGFGFSSAACGSDILFLEAMLDAGAEISVVLPYNREDFARDSVDLAEGWRVRFDRVLEKAARVVTASNQRLNIGGVSYEFCNQLCLGMASIRTRQLDANLIPLAVWNGMSGDGPGGAATVVENWRSLGLKPIIVDLTKISPVAAVYLSRRSGTKADDRREHKRTKKSGGHPPSPGFGVTGTQPLQHFSSRIVAILFADAVGFSKLSELEVPRFVQHFLGAIAQLGQNFRNDVIARNTWGDGLYFVFADVEVAGNFALQLADLVAATKWQEKELPSLNLRIALHAGPVYEFNDPITGSRSYSGTHVSRAARIEPITPPGQVYASEAFAALAAAKRTKHFMCDYVGRTPLAKGYGTLPTYHVRRNA